MDIPYASTSKFEGKLNTLVFVKETIFLSLSDLIKKGTSHSCVYGDVINKAKKKNSDTSKLTKYLKKKIAFVKDMI